MRGCFACTKANNNNNRPPPKTFANVAGLLSPYLRSNRNLVRTALTSRNARNAVKPNLAKRKENFVKRKAFKIGKRVARNAAVAARKRNLRLFYNNMKANPGSTIFNRNNGAARLLNRTERPNDPPNMNSRRILYLYFKNVMPLGDISRNRLIHHIFHLNKRQIPQYLNTTRLNHKRYYLMNNANVSAFYLRHYRPPNLPRDIWEPLRRPNWRTGVRI